MPTKNLKPEIFAIIQAHDEGEHEKAIQGLNKLCLTQHRFC